MAKETKTANELQNMIAAELNAGGLYNLIQVHKDPVQGWRPTVVSDLGNGVTLQQRADEIAARLRPLYDLAR
jgi:hypothetical protein